MKNIIKSILAIIFVCVGIFGFLCLVSEADPWTVESQIRLFIKGLVMMLIGFGGMSLLERSESNDIVGR